MFGDRLPVFSSYETVNVVSLVFVAVSQSEFSLTDQLMLEVTVKLVVSDVELTLLLLGVTFKKGASTVVKFHTFDQALDPPALFAFILQ